MEVGAGRISVSQCGVPLSPPSRPSLSSPILRQQVSAETRPGPGKLPKLSFQPASLLCSPPCHTRHCLVPRPSLCIIKTHFAVEDRELGPASHKRGCTGSSNAHKSKHTSCFRNGTPHPGSRTVSQDLVSLHPSPCGPRGPRPPAASAAAQRLETPLSNCKGQAGWLWSREHLPAEVIRQSDGMRDWCHMICPGNQDGGRPPPHHLACGHGQCSKVAEKGRSRTGRGSEVGRTSPSISQWVTSHRSLVPPPCTSRDCGTDPFTARPAGRPGLR